MVMKTYDVVIVGAGPAGLKCAEILSKSNKKVLVLEKNKEIGPKVCAGGLLGHDINYLKLPKEILDHEYNQVKLHTPFNNDNIKLDKPFIWTIDRKNLGQWQLKKIKNKPNINIKINSKVTEINKNSIVINNSEKIQFKYLVGADGSNSIVRNFLKKEKQQQLIGIQYIIPKKNCKCLEIFFDSNLFHSWYAWIFPHKNYVSIGCGCDPKIFSSEKIQKNFKKWLKERNIDVSKAEYQAFPINYDFQGYKFKNIFLVGDAAGFASGLTGEGIYPALISGEEVARIILNKKYNPIKIKELIKTKKRHNEILKVLENSGPLREIEYETLALLLKLKFVDKELINLESQ